MMVFDAPNSYNLNIYGLNTIGALHMVYGNSTTMADAQFNPGVYPSTIVYYKTPLSSLG